MTDEDRAIYARVADNLGANTVALRETRDAVLTLPQRISVVVPVQPPARVTRADLLMVACVAGLVCGLVVTACR